MITLDDITLKHGRHDSREQGVCAMEAAAWLAGEPHSDSPECVSPVIAAFVRSWNDGLPTDEDRDRLLKPFLPRIIGTAGDGHDEARAWMCVDWLVRVQAPAWLDLAGMSEHAALLRGLPEVTADTRETWAGPLESAREDAAAAWAAARDAAWDAAWDAARDAAWDAARAAAVGAARAAAWAAAWVAARAPGGGAAGDAAWDAAVGAARGAAWVAAGAAAWDAAGDAAGAALAPTVIALQAEAVSLLERMVALGEDVRVTGSREQR